MKRLACMGICVLFAWASNAEPVSVEEAGITPLTDSILISTDEIGNGYRIESMGVAIVEDKIIVVWEDDPSGNYAVWMFYDTEGNALTEAPQSFRRPDGNPTSTRGIWGPKIKANMYGDGAVFGSIFWDWFGAEDNRNDMPEFNDLDGDAPAIQLLSNNADFEGHMFLGLPKDYLMREGGTRISDIDFLSDGHILVTAEDRKAGVGDMYGLISNRVVVAAKLTPSGEVVAGPVNVSMRDGNGEAWHGAATFPGGFAVRYQNDGPRIRFFDNDLNPLTDDIALADIDPLLNSGGRGDGTGFKGNGKGDVLLVTSTGAMPYAAVINSNAEVVVGPVDPDEPFNADMGLGSNRVDGALDEDGNFVVVYDDKNFLLFDGGAIVARCFYADGTPATEPFVVTDFDVNEAFSFDEHPRVAIRNGIIAVTWHDRNFMDLVGSDRVGYMRFFESPFEPTSHLEHWEIMN